VPGLDIAAHCLPAKEVGGDFFGYYRLAANHTTSRELIVTVGDVSGKGIPAALYMAVSSSALATQVALSSSIVELYAALNLILHPRTAQTRINTALLTVHLDRHDDQWLAHVVNAGLIAPLHRRAALSSYLEVGGLPLGAVPAARYRHIDQPLEYGDWLIMCSDGIIEAMNGQREMYGFERLQSHVSGSAATTAAAMVATIMQDIETFTGGADQHDDMTVVVIRVVDAGNE
jgi:serine phosphatase RsbU (regulator of sigma subunit)